MAKFKLNKNLKTKINIAQYVLGSETDGLNEVSEILRIISLLILGLLVVLVAILVFTVVPSL